MIKSEEWDFVITYIFYLPGHHHQLQDAPSRCLVRPAADDDFAICRNPQYGQVLVLLSRCLVCLAADDDFVIFLFTIKYKILNINIFPFNIAL